MRSDTILIFSTDGKVYRSTDDITFTVVLTAITSPLVSNGVNSNGSVVCFGEYVNTDGVPVRIYTSPDNGVTWSIALNVGNSVSGGLRHFHTCQYIRSHNVWIATTGDSITNWYKSFDGTTWTLIFTSTNQYNRTLGIVMQETNKLIWGSDGSIPRGGVFTRQTVNGLDSIDEADVRRLLTSTSSYGLIGNTDMLVYTTMTASSNKNSMVANVFVSLSGGNTWELDKSFIVDAGTTYGGIVSVIGLDNSGNFYLQLQQNNSESVCIKATYQADNIRTPITKISSIYPRKKVMVKKLSIANAVVGGGINTFKYIPTPGTIETIIGINFSIPAVAGATTGTHAIQLTIGVGSSVGRIFTATAAYSASVALLSYGLGAGTTFSETGLTFGILQNMLMGRQLNLMTDTPCIIYYNNTTDVARTDTIDMYLTVLQETVSQD